MPDGPWIMTQTWHDLLFAHWPVDPEKLRAVMPAGLAPDLYEGKAWLGIVPFRMTNVAPRGVGPIPFVSAFPELNVRTYVTLDRKPGIYFFSLDAGSAVAVAAARALFGLPYYTATMQVNAVGDRIVYRSRRNEAREGGAEFGAQYAPVGPVLLPTPGTLEHFLVERYCLYTVDDSFRARRLEIHHPPWPLQTAEAEIGVNTMAEAAGLTLPATMPLLHFAKRQDMVAWPMERV